MSSRPVDPELGEDLDVLLVSVSARLNRLHGHVLGQLATSLTFRQHRTLQRIHQGHTSLAVLAALGNLTVPTVSENVDVLVRRGLVKRQANPESRRSNLLSLTPAGVEANEAANAALADVNRELLDAVPEEQRPVLHEALAAIYDAATVRFRRGDGTAVRGPMAAVQRRET